MIKISNKSECCGCGACVEACPVKIISFNEDSEGFVYPKADYSKCVDCGICEAVCPVMNIHSNEEEITSCSYGAYNRQDDDRINGSSGGIFGLVASKIIEQGGIVCGAAYTDDYSVEHILVEDEHGLKRLHKSKYVQSINRGVYSRIKAKLIKGKTVLYTGTACQVAGLKKYLRKEYDKLYTIDVLCHGVPSPKLLRKYIKELETSYSSRIKNVDFRNKVESWRDYSVKIEFENNEVLKERFYNNNYMRLFLSNICLRPSCHDCRYKDMNRPSDMTIGDFWGVENVLPEIDDDKGTSVVKVNTHKGKMILDMVRESLEYREVNIDVALPADADSRKSVLRHIKRDVFFKDLDKKSISQLTRLLEPSLGQKIKNKLRKIKSILLK